MHTVVMDDGFEVLFFHSNTIDVVNKKLWERISGKYPTLHVSS